MTTTDPVHLTGRLKTRPTLTPITRPDGTPTVRLINTLVGPDRDRCTIVFDGDLARQARSALASGAAISISGRYVGPRRIEVDQWQTIQHPAPARLLWVGGEGVVVRTPLCS